MSAKKHVLGSDLARVDAHAITPAEYDELPELTELTEADLGRGVWMDPDVLSWCGLSSKAVAQHGNPGC